MSMLTNEARKHNCFKFYIFVHLKLYPSPLHLPLLLGGKEISRSANNALWDMEASEENSGTVLQIGERMTELWDTFEGLHRGAVT